MAVPIVIGTGVTFGIASSPADMVAITLSANETSNKVEAKNINGGTAAVAFTGKKIEYSAEGYATGANSVCVGSTLSITQFGSFASDVSGTGYVEEVVATKSSEDFVKLKYKIVKRDGIS